MKRAYLRRAELTLVDGRQCPSERCARNLSPGPGRELRERLESFQSSSCSRLLRGQEEAGALHVPRVALNFLSLRSPLGLPPSL